MAAFPFRLGFRNALLEEGNAFGEDAILGTNDAFNLVLYTGIGGGGRDGDNCWNPVTFDFTRNCNNIAHLDWGTIGGGIGNTGNGEASTVTGGSSNSALSHKSAVSGGFNNEANGVGGSWPRASAVPHPDGGDLAAEIA